MKKYLFLFLGIFFGIFIVLIIGSNIYFSALPSLSLWHKTILKNEFTTLSNVKNIQEYRKLEDRLFKELDQKIYAQNLSKENNYINRYAKNSLSDPKRWHTAWNKTFELTTNNPKMGVLLLHGMSDSPYSLHTQAMYLQKKGVLVLGLRLPGHGTIPSGLIHLKWQDMAAVVKMGMQYLAKKLPNKPIHIMGYSTGATLALNYTFDALNDTTLRVPSSLVLYSPAIGVTPVASLAIWQNRIGKIFGLKKLAWNAIASEYDPYKYNSFAVNAGDQVYKICNHIQKQLKKYPSQTHTKKFPPVLSFASIVDNTVKVSATKNYLYEHLPKGRHILTLFDINHHFVNNHLINQSVNTSIQELSKHTNPNYTLKIISNKGSTNDTLKEITNNKISKNLLFKWPNKLYSLSHLAIPISPNDPLYGNKNAPKSPGIQLGHLAIYGENAVLQISGNALLRQRWNPFHDYIKKNVLEFLNLK